MLATSLMGQHRFVEARSVAERLVALDSADRPARAMLGEIQLELGAYEDARRTFGMLLTVRSDLAVAPRYARWEELRGRPAEARRLLREARDEASRRHGMPAAPSPGSTGASATWRCAKAGCGEAEKELEAGLAVAPDDHRLLDALARAAAARGRWREAIELGERAIAKTLDPATLGLLYQVYAASGDSAKAEEYYRAMSVAVLGQPATFHRQWGLLLLDRGREVPDRARARRARRSRTGATYTAGICWPGRSTGRAPTPRRATRCAHALALGTRDAMLFYHAGMIEAALGRRDAARRHLETALAINPHWHPLQPAKRRRVARPARGGRGTRSWPNCSLSSGSASTTSPIRRRWTTCCSCSRWRRSTGGATGASAVWVVTAFTVGHSVTLALAVTGALRAPDRPHRVPHPGDDRGDRGGEPPGARSRTAPLGRPLPAGLRRRCSDWCTGPASPTTCGACSPAPSPSRCSGSTSASSWVSS